MKKSITIALLSWMLFAMPISAMSATVLIDPGHGGSDPGAIGVTGLREKEVNLDIALRVRDELVARGYQVIMTRSSDVTLSLQDRIVISRSVKPDILVSIHANSYHTPDVSGTIVLYYDNRYPQARYPASEEMIRLSPESRKLAEALLKAAVKAAGTVDRGLLESSVYMVRMGNVPSALIETAFLSNPGDEKKLRDPAFRQKMAIGIADGISNYLPVSKRFGDVTGHWAEAEILQLVEKGIAEGNGYSFFPDRQITRAEFVTMLDRGGLIPRTAGDETVRNEERNPDQDRNVYEVLNHDPDNGQREGNSVMDSVYGGAEELAPNIGSEGKAEEPVLSFIDLSERHWAYESMMRAVESGVLEGFPDGTIRPDANISRAEAAVILDRLLYDPSRKAKYKFRLLQTPPFADVQPTSWFADAVLRLWNDQLISGVSAVSFAPDRFMTRAEAAVLIGRSIRTTVL
jgi:N-acetylmuramoyl-L-alanine amidase